MKKVLYTLTLFTVFATLAQQESRIIKSDILPREVEVITYDTNPADPDKPIVYITDGRKFINSGSLKKIKTLTDKKQIDEAYYVFVSTRNTKTGEDHRNEYFFTNQSYVSFFEKELIPEIEKDLEGIGPEDRSHVGISFGGLNAAYFSAKSDQFKNFGVLSPITYPRKKVYQDIVFSENKGLKIYLSTGKNDAESYTNKLKELYESKDYELKTRFTQGGHNFDNWNGQLEEMLNFFFK